jgi:hypothetical protein
MERSWLVSFEEGIVQMRCSFRKQRNKIEKFVVQLETMQQGKWQAVIRYDNAHGYCHQDILHPNGNQEKQRVEKGDANQTFTFAVDDIRANWEKYLARYLGEIE